MPDETYGYGTPVGDGLFGEFYGSILSFDELPFEPLEGIGRHVACTEIDCQELVDDMTYNHMPDLQDALAVYVQCLQTVNRDCSAELQAYKDALAVYDDAQAAFQRLCVEQIYQGRTPIGCPDPRPNRV